MEKFKTFEAKTKKFPEKRRSLFFDGVQYESTLKKPKRYETEVGEVQRMKIEKLEEKIGILCGDRIQKEKPTEYQKILKKWGRDRYGKIGKNFFQELFKQKTVIDLGCGTGVSTRWSAELGAEKVIGIDNNKTFLDYNKKINKTKRMGNIELIEGNYLNQNFPKESANIITSFSALPLDKPEIFKKIIVKFKECLKRGGYFIYEGEIVSLHEEKGIETLPLLANPLAVEELFEQEGFKNVAKIKGLIPISELSDVYFCGIIFKKSEDGQEAKSRSTK